MKIIKYLIILLMSIIVSAVTFEEYSSNGGDNENISNRFKYFEKRLLNKRSINQEKRDISLSYAATNINNKEGTQVKTITVIKNLTDKKGKLKIDPELHKNENWAETFKDNFDSYGIIPDVPDVDDLFEYVNKKHNKEKNNENKNDRKKDNDNKNQKPITMDMEKPVTEISPEISEEITENFKSVEKIKGDSELLSNSNSSRLSVRELMNLNYSNPAHSLNQYFENYVQLSQGGKAVDDSYNYLKPCVHTRPIGSATIATPSGKTYNIPDNNNSYINPYLAPAITRRPQIIQQSTTVKPSNVPTFPINSLVPPLQQQQNKNPTLNFLIQQNSAGSSSLQPQLPNISLQTPIFQSNFQTNQQQQPHQNNNQGQNLFPSTSQRPYVSPNIRSGLSGVSRGPGSPSNSNSFQNSQPDNLFNTFNNDFRKTNNFRSRGIKY